MVMSSKSTVMPDCLGSVEYCVAGLPDHAGPLHRRCPGRGLLLPRGHEHAVEEGAGLRRLDGDQVLPVGERAVGAQLRRRDGDQVLGGHAVGAQLRRRDGDKVLPAGRRACRGRCRCPGALA